MTSASCAEAKGGSCSRSISVDAYASWLSERSIRGGDSIHRGSTHGCLRSLPSHIDRGLLRAVSATEVLSGFGRHFSSNAGTAEQHALSQPSEEMDAFLSHDWRTTRLQKVLSLCFFFNVRGAFIASCVLALPLAYIGSSPALSSVRGELAKLGCPLIYFIALFFGQRLSTACRSPCKVFLDKLCIHQTDEQLKTEGILGLAGFLRASRQLVVLWSPRYFSRLWCTYELVTWCYLHGLDARRVQFLPVSWCAFHCLVVACWSGVEMLKLLIRKFYIPQVELGQFLGDLTLSLVGVLLIPVVYRCAVLLQELSLVNDQVQSFAIRDSKCFCCTHHHIHPETGQKMACDRRVVHATLHRWHLRLSQNNRMAMHDGGEMPGDWEGVEQALDKFDEAVRNELSSMISHSMDGALLCLRYRDCVFACVPVLYAAFDYVVLVCRDARYLHATRWVLGYSVVPLFVFPLAIAAVIKSNRTMARRTSAFQASQKEVLSGAVGAFVFLFVFQALWFPGQIVIAQGESLELYDVVLLLHYLGLAVLTRLVIRPRGTDLAAQPAAGGEAADVAEEEKTQAVCTTHCGEDCTSLASI
eukprot:TRINITY_DN16822_c0_g1_i1.p1 TRINITY_DN16822_c0_g1~~TRINITY_DN16822_c0_g1_i1.p1  ORF type:complete len:585 (-),score=24.09 TRINITY_DN16822_c0_g1_i1:139-1893(-)